MRKLILGLETELSLDMSILRDGAFRKEVPDEPIYDPFDDGSVHILARVDGEPVCMARVSPWPVCPMGSWLKLAESPNPFPTGAGSVELTGTVVSPDYRNRGLYRLLMLATLLYCRTAGYSSASAAVEPDFPACAFLEQAGFQTQPEPLLFVSQIGDRLTALPYWLDIAAPLPARWRALLEEQCRACAQHGLEVVMPPAWRASA